MIDFPTKEQAFATPAGMVSIPLIRDHDYRFERNWFKYRNQDTFSTFLRARFANHTNLRMIQIGVFEGMDLIWQLQQLKITKAFAIDPWLGTGKLNQEAMDRHRSNAYHNLSFYNDRVEIIHEMSQSVLHRRNWGEIDYIVIDGDHHEEPCFKDAIMSFRIVKPKGWLIFDDFYNRREKERHVKHAVRRFADMYQEKVRLAWAHRHVVCLEKLKQ